MVSVWIRWFSVGVGGFAGSLKDPPSGVEFRILSLSKKQISGRTFGVFSGGVRVVLVVSVWCWWVFRWFWLACGQLKGKPLGFDFRFGTLPSQQNSGRTFGVFLGGVEWF